ncbi:MAG: hypothetical protein KC546_10245 [Anaerolineae bacterium]|nr:hypothetical protein [Anaerolineae bacterium]
MQKLLNTLRDSDPGMVEALAEVWGVNLARLDEEAALSALQEAMLSPEKVEDRWDRLDDRERGALQMLLATQLKMPTAQFEIAFGKIRKMGKGAIERDKPYKNAESAAERLFYWGLIAESYEQTKKGMRATIYIPEDLAAILPAHKTSYANLKDEMEAESAFQQGPVGMMQIEEEELEFVQPADTSIVDDMTTLLAYLRVHTAEVEGDRFLPVEEDRLIPHMLMPSEPRLTFTLGLGVAADLITTQEGRAHAKRTTLQRWLSAPRGQQLKALAVAWQKTALYQELWHTPGLHPEDGTNYDAAGARNAALQLLADNIPAEDWWSIEEFITLVKAKQSDFLRNDYDSWYIRDDRGDYLRGYDTWDQVEGAYLETLLIGPMHWLGLLDLAEDAAHLTIWGKAFLGLVDWPQPNIPEEVISYDPDENRLIASRKVPTVDRFQLARFTQWLPTGDPYEYVLDAESIQRAGAQGITTGHMHTFLMRHLGDDLPEHLAKLLEVWQGGGAATQVTFENLLVLRTTSPEVLDRINNDPALRRYLGARLGPMAVIVRADQADSLKAALEEAAIGVSFS